MLKRNVLFMLISVLCLSLFWGCGDDDEDTPTSPVDTKKIPEISSISPDSVKVGEKITITGENFGEEVYKVNLNGVEANSSEYFMSWADTEISLKVPVGTLTGNVTVSTEDGTSNEYMLIIYEDEEDPVDEDSLYISFLNVDEILAGEKLVINGSDFGDTRGDSYVDFNGDKASEYISWSNVKIEVTVPSYAGSGNVTVVKTDETSNAVYLTVNHKPKLTTLIPATAKVGEGVRIVGSHFGDTQGDGAVYFGDIQAQVSSWKDSEINTVVPEGAVTCKVKIYANGYYTEEKDFTVQKEEQDEDPTLTSINPLSGQKGTDVTLRGTNFGDSRDDSYVDFNGTQVAESGYVSWSATEIVVTVPDNATTGPVTVHVGEKTTNGIEYTVISKFELLTMIEIPAGTFTMGFDTDEDMVDYKPAHTITISNAYYMSETEITQKQWSDIMDKSNPSKYALGDDYPVEQVTWYRTLEFCNKLSTVEGYTPCYTINGSDVTCNFNANGYRLPTEAEWEYACRAGNTGDYCTDGDIGDYAWCAENSGINTNPVKQKSPNAFGLYDMHGNVWEWCWDWYEYEYYEDSPDTDPVGPDSGFGERVRRGGSFMDGYAMAKSYIRGSFNVTNDNYNGNLGFRVVRNK